jgi:hypothetical protein
MNINQSVSPIHAILHAIHTYHSRLIPEGVAEAFQIFLRDAHVLPKLFHNENYCRHAGGKPIAVRLQPISGAMEERDRCYSVFSVPDTPPDVF